MKIRAQELACLLLFVAPIRNSLAQANAPKAAVTANQLTDKPANKPAQDPITVTTRISPEQPRVGDLITYQINVAYPQGYAVNLPRLLELKPLEVVGREEGAEASSGQGLVRQFTLTLQAFSVEGAKIPSFELTYVDAQAQVHTKRVPASKLDMRSMTANEAEPERRGEDPMVSPEYPNRRAELVIFALLGGIALAAILYLLWRWLAPQRNTQVAVPVIPPHKQATEGLDRLEAGIEQRFKDGAGVLVYLELTEIAKRYLGARHGVECLDRTTYEIEEELRQNPQFFGPVDADAVRKFMRNCDLIKFARVATDVEDARTQLQEVRTWIDCSETAAQKTAAPVDETPQQEESRA